MRFRAARISLAFAAAAAVGACETDSPTGPGEEIVVTVTAPENAVVKGLTLQLTATVSQGGSQQGVTWSTSHPTRATVDASGLVLGTGEGVATIIATSIANPASRASVELTVHRCATLTSADVGNGGTLHAGVCYQAQSALAVNGGTLVVDPGVVVEFGPNAYLTINSGGRLSAAGTAIDPITFTSMDPVGSWRGVNFDGSRGSENVLAYVTVQNGGSAGWSGAGNSRSAVNLRGNSLVNIQNSTISGSGGQGITVSGGSEMVFENNTLSGNAVAAWVHPDAAGYIGGNTTFTGNTANVVRVVFGNNDAVTTAQTWQTLAVPYEIQDRFYIHAPLTVAPGATLAFTANASALVRNDGSLRAVGTASSPIMFRSVEKDFVFWKGLSISTATADNVFQWVTFENGGSQAWAGGSDANAMIWLEGNSRAVFTDCTFLGSSSYALRVPAGGDIPNFQRNRFEGNVRTIYVHPNRAGSIAAINVFVGNTENKVRVTFGNNDAVTTAQTWHDFGVPFYVTVRTYVQAALTIAAGTEIEFAQNASMIVNEGGSLRAAGTPTAPVALRGGENLSGYWKGIQYGTASAGNALSYVTVSNAGSDGWFGGSNSTGSLWITNDGFLALSNVTFQQSGGYAVIVSSGGGLTCSGVNYGGFQIYDFASNAALSICP